MAGADAALVVPWGGRWAPWLCALVLGALLVIIALLVTPARTDQSIDGARVVPSASSDFSQRQIARGDALAAATRPWSLTGYAVSIVVAAALGFSPLGARLMTWAGSALGGGPWARLLLGGLLILAIARLSTLVFDLKVRSARQAFGLVTQSWTGWFVDLLKNYAIQAVVVLGVAALARLLILAMPRAWWVALAGGAALAVIALSFVAPLVIEPLFNHFTPLPDGQLRTAVMQLANDEGVPVRDVLVADASQRTTALNAYVSGFGASRRVVVYDNLLKDVPDDQVLSVVAHELGHARANDVLLGTLLAALGAAAVACFIAGALSTQRILEWIGADAPSDPRVLPFVLAVAVVVTALTMPFASLVSRRIEARADLAALNATRDPAALIEVQRRLALTNVSDVTPPPVLYALFGTHPTAPERIAVARAWARAHDVEVAPRTDTIRP